MLEETEFDVGSVHDIETNAKLYIIEQLKHNFVTMSLTVAHEVEAARSKQFIMRHELGFLKLLVLENKLDGVGTFQRGSEILQIFHDSMGQNCATWLISRGMLVVTFRG